MSDSIKPYFTYGVSASDRDLITSTTTYSGQHKRYFSSLDAEIFIGGERVLDINRIDFSYEEKKIPYYGFNSFWPSKIFTGQKMIQGTFVINFTETGYISKLLQRIEASDMAKDFDYIGQPCTLENSPLFGKSFDITIGYGGYNIDEEASFRNTHQILKGVNVNGYQQILDTSGEPVLEVYSFIARDLRFGGYDYELNKPNGDNNNNNSGSTDDKTNLTGVEIVEQRLNDEVTRLEEKCNKHKDYLGVVVNIKHSLHVKDLDSHLYVEIIKQYNTTPYNSVKDKQVMLTLSDNDLGPSETFALDLENGVYHIRLNKDKTAAIVKRLSQPQKTISGSLEIDISYKGESKPIKKSICLVRGDNYDKKDLTLYNTI